MRVVVGLLALTLAACGESSAPPSAPPQVTAPMQPVSSEVWNAPNSELEAVEPTIFQIVGAPTVWDALAPLGRAFEGGEGAPTLTVHFRTEGDGQVADIVRTGLADDSLGSEHIRIEFRREPEGWYPTNAYRRHTCRRASDPQLWSSAPCP